MIEFRLDRGSPTFGVIKGPIPALRVKTISRVRGLPENPPKPAVSMYLRARAHIQGVPISDVTDDAHHVFGQQLGFMDSHELNLELRLPRYIIDAIEGTRTDNVGVDVSVELGYWTPQPTGPYEQFGWTSAPFQERIPQSEWLLLLEELGYRGGWVVEVPKPTVAGIEQVRKHLDSAFNMLQTHHPAGAVAECRKAWDRADDLLRSREQSSSRVIEGLSTGEADEPKKSDRVKAIRASVDKWVQIGPHSDLYEVTMEDAFLSYRLTVSLLAYLARALSLAEIRG